MLAIAGGVAAGGATGAAGGGALAAVERAVTGAGVLAALAGAALLAVRFAAGRDWALRLGRDCGSAPLSPRAISGPAVNPTSAPAAAPTGPSMSAPDTAPSTVVPTRSCACAADENTIPARTAAAIRIFMAVSLNAPRATGFQNWGDTRVAI